MAKNLMATSLVVLLSCGGVSQAHPLDSPDIVYIDGLPCNSACQSYMKWSRQQLSPVMTPARRSPEAARHTSVKHQQSPGARLPAHIARQMAPMPRTRVAEPQPVGKPEANSEPARPSATTSSAADGAVLQTRTIRQQVAAATTLAEQVTMSAAGPAPSQNTPDNVIALVIVHSDIKAVADLAGKDVAIDEPQSASSGAVRTAIAAAGATEVQLSPGETKAIDRLIDGDVPAAVLALVSKEAGDWFPDIAGFRVFRVPLSPAAHADTTASTPVDGALTRIRTLREQVAAATTLAEHVTTAATGRASPPEHNGADQAKSTQPSDAVQDRPISGNAEDNMVALVMARSDIKSVADLGGKDIAIDAPQSASTPAVLTAIAAAGATEVQLSLGQTKAIDRLIDGDVPAAVLTLVSKEAGDWFPDIAGFRVFRIPLSPNH